MHEYSDENDQPNRCVKCSGVLQKEEWIKLEGTDRMVACVNAECSVYGIWAKVHAKR